MRREAPARGNGRLFAALCLAFALHAAYGSDLSIGDARPSVSLSALLTVTMPSIKTTIEALKTAGVRDKVKVMVGGAPVTQQFADQVGADAYSENATAAVTAARRLVAVG